MQKLLWFVSCCILIAPALALGQNPSKTGKDGWGPWRYTWQAPEYWSGIPFRSKCVSNSGGDSVWEYQFRSRYDGAMDFVEREEHGVDGSTTNDFNRPEAFTFKGGALSPVFETRLHGTCEELRELKHELKIEVMCVTEHDQYGEGNFRCFQDENGAPLEFKRIPDHPRYQ
ncbi:MAG: hypothetical protein WAM85_07890 [Terracidiphilus sp.]